MRGHLTAIDLFSGAGGIALGLEQEGYKVVFANDVDRAASASYQRNFPESPFAEGDIRDLSVKRILQETGLASGELDVLIGGPPCQGFSIIGARREEDPRNDLFREFLRIAQGLKPKSLIMENVPGLLTMAEGK